MSHPAVSIGGLSVILLEHKGSEHDEKVLKVSIGGLSVILLELSLKTGLHSKVKSFNRRVVGYTTGATLRNRPASRHTCFNRRVVGYTTGAQ